MKIKAYKVFNSKWKCKNHQYQVGQIYELSDSVIPCTRGFHACKKLVDCFNYYSFDPKNKVAEVELSGEIIEHGNKLAASRIEVICELTWGEVLNLVNTGDSNTGYRNTGDRNTGNWNTGYRNTGDGNTGNWNTGNSNTGNWNTGNSNTGHSNTGDGNTGYGNTGNWNTGNWNTGFFNSTTPQTVVAFNSDCGVSFEAYRSHRAYGLCQRLRPTYYRRNGKRYAMPYKQWWSFWWSNLTRAERNTIRELPGYTYEVFSEITGLKAFELRVQNGNKNER